MSVLIEADLILNNDGSVYHLRMRPENLADIVILVGDPQRLKDITKHFTNVDHSASNREFISITGFFKGRRMTALSTGIGTSNGDIIMHELDALANFNLETREQFPVLKPLTIIRIGTTSTIQRDVPINSFIISTHAVGLDNLMLFYRDTGQIIDQNLTQAFAKFSHWPESLSLPYFIKGSDRLIQRFSQFAIQGITATSPGFFGPQARYLKLDPADPEMLRKLQSFQFGKYRIVNFDMETSALYGLGGLMGHEMITIYAVIANRVTGEYNANYMDDFNNLIKIVLENIHTQ